MILFLICNQSFTQNVTDVSLFMKRDKENYRNEVESKSGNLFSKIGHHGPAIENQWFGLRIYFDKRVAVDVYSKTKPGLELRKSRWYPSKTQQKNGWGADYYKVGKTVGLGGIKLWDGEKVISLNTVTSRKAKVKTEGSISYMEMLSEGIPIKGKKVDILVRITVNSENRKAHIEAYSQTNVPVQFVTGINYHKGLRVEKSMNYIATWGIHPEDVAAEKIEVGAAIIYKSDDFEKQSDNGNQFLFISKPTTYLETWVTSANGREQEINSFDKFIEYLNNLQ